MKKYRLKKELPTFKVGEEFSLSKHGGLWRIDGYDRDGEWHSNVCAYSAATLKKFPNILKDWFEEIPERPKTVFDLKEGDLCWIVSCCELGYAPMRLRFGKLARVMRETGSLYLTEEDAKKDIARNKAETILKRDTKGFEPDWNDYSEKYWVGIDHQNGGKVLVVDYNIGLLERKIYFATREDAEKSIKKHPQEWKTYLGVEESEYADS